MISRTERGRRGYAAAVAKMGSKFDFHSAGGEATAKIDAWTCPCHGVGITAYTAHNRLKGKKHRYNKAGD
jgi:hypothetical protein